MTDPNRQWGNHQTGYDEIERVQKVVLVAWNPQTLQYEKLSTDNGGNLNVANPGIGSASMTINDGADIAEGATTDLAVTSNAAGTVSGKLRGLVAILADVWESASHYLRVGISSTVGLKPSDTLTAVAAVTQITNPVNAYFGSSPSTDAFSRLRVSSPMHLFDAQLTYDLQPLLYEQITALSGATIAYDSTNRCALMTFASTPTGGSSYMQTFQYFPYQPGRSQQIFVTFNFIEKKANVLKFAGYSDGVNGIELQTSGTTTQIVLYSSTSNGNEVVTQLNWNLDPMNGAGTSGISLDLTKVQIFVIDFQALYTGRVRVGFDIGGVITYVHEFLHSNLIANPYIATANLPVRCGMTCSGTVSTTMNFICCSVCSEGGEPEIPGYTFEQKGTATAADGVRTHILSLRKKTTFNGIANRMNMRVLEINILVIGNYPVFWELCLGDVLTGTTTFNDVNTTYSGMQYNTAGTTSGNPAIVVDSGFVPATNQSRGATSEPTISRYPFALNAAGANRPLGTYTLLLTAIGGASVCQASMSWRELR